MYIFYLDIHFDVQGDTDIYLHIYIYVFIRVCVCVCVSIHPDKSVNKGYACVRACLCVSQFLLIYIYIKSSRFYLLIYVCV